MPTAEVPRGCNERGVWRSGRAQDVESWTAFMACQLGQAPALTSSTTPQGWYCFVFAGTLRLRDGGSLLKGSLLQRVAAQAAVVSASTFSMMSPHPQTTRHHTKGFTSNPPHNTAEEALLIRIYDRAVFAAPAHSKPLFLTLPGRVCTSYSLYRLAPLA